MLDDGCYGSVRKLAAAAKLGRSYLGRLLMLTLLAPEIVEGRRGNATGADEDASSGAGDAVGAAVRAGAKIPR